MPIIFAQAIMFIPMTVAQSFGNASVQGFLAPLAQFDSFAYNAVFFVMIVLFTYFYTAITVNPKQMADDMKKNGGFIPGVKPGKATSEYLDSVMSTNYISWIFVFRFCCYFTSFCNEVF